MIRLITYLLLCFPVLIHAESLYEKANSAYQEENFEKSIQLYDSVLQSNQSYEVFFNLGNAHYKMNNYAKALLMYEKASRLKPQDEDLKVNLKLTRNKLKLDNNRATREISDLMNDISLWTIFPLWQYLAVLLTFVACILAYLIYWQSPGTKARHIFVYSLSGVVVLAIVSFLLAYRQYQTLFSTDEAIVMPNQISVYGEPSPNSNEVFQISGGFKVKILDRVGKWYEISINNGNVGWTLKENVELISLKYPTQE